jgi:putative Holliday junction resolvase
MSRILCIDHGSRVIGVAVSDSARIVARPVTLIERTSRAEDFEKIAALISEYAAGEIVVGLPKNPRPGEANPQEKTVRRWTRRLARAIAMPVILWNESFSSWDAGQKLADAGRERPGERIDDVAAAVILQSYLEAQRLPDFAEPEIIMPEDAP